MTTIPSKDPNLGPSPVGNNAIQAMDEEPGPNDVEPPLQDGPVPSGAAGALKQLDAKALAQVLRPTADGLAKAAAELGRPNPKLGKVEGRLRSIAKQLEALDPSQLSSAEGVEALNRMRGDVHRMLAATISDRGAGTRTVRDNLEAVSETLSGLRGPSLFRELDSGSPTSAEAVDHLLDSTPYSKDLRTQLAVMYPGADAFGGMEVLTKKLDADLAKGDLKTKMEAILRKRGVDNDHIASFFGALAEVRQGFEAGAASGDDMQRSNWIHTRVELLHTLEAADAVGLSPDQTLVAVLGSLFSDSFKDPSTFSLLWHNRAGAELTLPLVMQRHFDLGDRRMQRIRNQAMRVAHEHQITPAVFMSGAMAGFLNERSEAATEIVTKIANPTQQPQKEGEIAFGPEAQALLEKTGFPGWAVPTPGSEHYLASLVTMVGDIMQYPSPDGVLKIAVDIRDPEHAAAFMRDGTIKQAVTSSVGFSFAKGMESIEDDRLQKLAAGRQEAMERTLEEKIYPEVERRLRSHLGVEDGAPTPDIPYWNVEVPTQYPEGTPADQEKLTPEARASADLVKAIFQAVMAEHGEVPLDPFGHRGE